MQITYNEFLRKTKLPEEGDLQITEIPVITDTRILNILRAISFELDISEKHLDHLLDKVKKDENTGTVTIKMDLIKNPS